MYFTGTSVLNKRVRLAPARSFRELVNRFVNIAVPLHCTRERYWLMPESKRDDIKLNGVYLTPAEFKTSPTWRETDNAKCCNLIFLDLDVKNGQMPAAPFVANPSILTEQLEPFAFCAYHTINSRPEAPRIRVMVAAENIAVPDYPAAVQTIAKRLGLAGVNSESKVAVQPMFMPMPFDGEEAHPLFVSELEGRAFTTADIDGSAVAAATEKHKQPLAGSAKDHYFVFLRAPLEDVTLETAEEVLEHLDPDIDYRQWLNVAAALQHQFRDDQDEAYELFDLWSSKGSKYKDAAETEAKWRSFGPTPAGRLPVTMRSVLHMAQLSGWDASTLKKKAYCKLEDWLKACTTVNELVNEGLARICAAPLLSEVEEDTLLHVIVKHAKKELKAHVTVMVLRKELRRMKKTQQASQEKDKKPELPAWAMGICYITASNEFFKHRTGERFKPEVADRIFSRHLVGHTSMNDPESSRPLMRPQDCLLNVFKLPVVWDDDYDPGKGDENPVFEHEGRVFINTYRRTHPDSDEKGAEEAGQLMHKHLENLICEPEYRRILLDFMAYIVQNPGKKIRWAPLIQGAEGCGKSFLRDALGAVLGTGHVIGIGGQEIFSGYTEWATGRQVVALEEVRVVGQNRFEVMNVLKPLITNDLVTLKQRYRDTREVENRCNYLLFTNHHDALAVTANDRRYFVLKSRLQDKSQVVALGHDYFNTLYGMLRDNAAGLRAFFESWEISPGFNPHGHAPATVYLGQLVKDSASDTASAVRRLIYDADNPLVQADLVSSATLLNMIHNYEGLNKVTPQGLAAVLRDEGYHEAGRIMIGEERHPMWTHRAADHLDEWGGWAEAARLRKRLNLVHLHTEILL